MSSEKAKTTESTQESVLKSKAKKIDPQGASQLTEVNREIITDALSFINLVNTIELTGRNSLLLKILREGKSLWVTIQFVK